MIRQAITCDICGTEKKQTNHWFVVHDQGGELRVSGWNSRNRLRPGSKHLCGQTCLHKLVDDFMAKAIAVRGQVTSVDAADVAEVQERALSVDTSLTSSAAYTELESSARVVTPKTPAAPAPTFKAQAELVTMPGRPHAEALAAAVDEPPRYASRNWRAEAWERERKRELNAIDQQPDTAARRRARA